MAEVIKVVSSNHKPISDKPRLTYRSFNFGVSLVTKVILICLTIGFVWFMNSRPFDFHTLVEGATTENFIENWDYQETIEEINEFFNNFVIDPDSSNLPSWLLNIINNSLEFFLAFRYLSIALVSLAYVVGWLFGFVWYILGAL